ncbi:MULTISPECIES: hypothetical protein [Maribacter]|jgi:hypothetical protein|uniref:Uncharacterized protein n=2 Tax=Maribacter stanieri TaxID=440514 RepID=A0A1I6K197_9FLAO|nr:MULTISPECIES: hypothetical protein [Maribacter]SFR85022.1 hypothetical protein SAMN04488010_3363 [Maribacter stanieri]|tara:strand:+ start:321 stop:512 length:192 start_codon:yes stop_codon:yes gene_type:complete
MRKKKSNKVYSQEVIDTQHVFTEDNKVFIKKKTSIRSNPKEEWSPIKFTWVSVANVQDSLVLE